MDYNLFKKSVKNIKMSNDMKKRIAESCTEKLKVPATDLGNNQKQTGSAHFAFKRVIAVAAAVTICFTIAVPSLAANVPAVYDTLYKISPAAAQYFKPVQMSCEDNGIRMEVISAYIHGDTAEIYIAMQDLTGDRIDQTIDLFDSCNINTPFDNVGHCETVSYDEKTKTATFLINISNMNKKKMKGDKITFSVGQFLSHKQIFEGLPLEISTDKINLNPETQSIKASLLRGCSKEERKYTEILKPSKNGYSPVEGVTITGMGFIDNKLHIQVYYENIHKTDNHGYIYLKDKKGNTISDTLIDFWDKNRNGNYYEHIFDVSPRDINNGYTFYGDFYTCNSLTKGDWEVTFPLEIQE